MLETALANLRFASSMLLGRPFHRRSLDRIVDAMVRTQHEMGAIGADSGEVLAGPTLDEGTRQAMQGRRFRAQAVRAAGETSYYPAVFERAGLDPRRLRYEDVQRVPATPKQALRDDPEAFVRSGAPPGHRVTTTGTTGWPTSVYFADDELHLIGVLTTINFLTERVVLPDDIVQVSINTRARLGVTGVAFASAAIGAALHVAGLVSPAHTLALLSERHRLAGKKPRVSVMSTFPSYLGELVSTGRRLGYRPDDFGLERVLLGGEVLTEGLKRRARELLGPVEFIQNYLMTELAPFGANLCNQGHLHFEPVVGLVEVLDLDATRPARPGEPGVVVATPLPPFRDATILLRYNTEDVVQVLAGPFTCDLPRVPATSNLLGKLRLSVRHDHGWTFVRQVAEALEEVDAVPLPARFGFRAARGGVEIEVVAPRDDSRTRLAIQTRLDEQGVPVAGLRLVDDRDQLANPLPLRCDLREESLSGLERQPASWVQLAATAGGQ
jgi:phenylacetate-coenzyme A ligase PaaK-like adenylate-forming protein